MMDGDPSTLDHHPDAIHLHPPQGVLGADADDEGRELHLDQRQRVPRVGAGDETAQATAVRRRCKQFAPVAASAGRDDLTSPDSRTSTASSSPRCQSSCCAGGRSTSTQCNCRRKACRLRRRVQRPDSRRHRARAHTETIEGVGDDGCVRAGQPVDESEISLADSTETQPALARNEAVARRSSRRASPVRSRRRR
jgi:hypothetical protein